MPCIPIPIGRDTPAIVGPLLYCGGNLLAAAGGAASATLFDGLNNSGDYLDDLRCAASQHDVHFFDSGIFVLKGLFVDVGANVGNLVIYVDYDVPDAYTGVSVGQAT